MVGVLCRPHDLVTCFLSHRQRRSVNPLHVSSLQQAISVSLCTCFVIWEENFLVFAGVLLHLYIRCAFPLISMH